MSMQSGRRNDFLMAMRRGIHPYNRKPPLKSDYPGQTDLFTTFWRLAHGVWHKRAAAKKVGFSFSEETITETILLDLATMNASDISILPLTKPIEGKLGADWEWCFRDPVTGTYQRMLVQAKLLDDRERGYSHIDRFIGSTGERQIDRLMKTSTRLQVPAVYVFYNNLTDMSRLPPPEGNCEACRYCWGCSTALAEAASALLNSKMKTLDAKSFDKIKLLSRPWLCLLCECRNSQTPLPQRVLNSLHELNDITHERLSHIGVDVAVLDLPEQASTTPPPYLGTLLDVAGISDQENRDYLLQDIKTQLPGIDGIVLVTQRSED